MPVSMTATFTPVAGVAGLLGESAPVIWIAVASSGSAVGHGTERVVVRRVDVADARDPGELSDVVRG